MMETLRPQHGDNLLRDLLPDLKSLAQDALQLAKPTRPASRQTMQRIESSQPEILTSRDFVIR